MNMMAPEATVSPTEFFAVMPRARELGSAALELCAPYERKVMSGDAFVAKVRHFVKDIRKWAHYHEEWVPDQVRQIESLSDEELRHMQAHNRFAGVQVLEWAGEMKMQISISKKANVTGKNDSLR